MEKRELDNLTVKEVKELCAIVEGKRPATKHPYTIGANYFIRTVTYFFTGRLVEVTAHELVLEEACWIADTGRFNRALNSGDFGETEPYPDGRVIVGRGALIDASIWKHKLPRTER